MIEKRVNFDGDNVFVRTVTYHYTGRVELMDDEFVVLTDAAWIAMSGRWAEFMRTGQAEEVEPYPDGVRVSLPRSAITEITEFRHDLPREVVG